MCMCVCVLAHIFIRNIWDHTLWYQRLEIHSRRVHSRPYASVFESLWIIVVSLTVGCMQPALILRCFILCIANRSGRSWVRQGSVLVATLFNICMDRIKAKVTILYCHCWLWLCWRCCYPTWIFEISSSGSWCILHWGKALWSRGIADQDPRLWGLLGDPLQSLHTCGVDTEVLYTLVV